MRVGATSIETEKLRDHKHLARRQGIVSIVLAVPGLILLCLEGINTFVFHNRPLELRLSYMGFEYWLTAFLWAPIVVW